MLACVELSEGHLSQAKLYADEFIKREPSVADGKVLRELIAQRKADPTESWTHSFASAWRASGSPQMTIDNFSFSESSCGQADKCEPREIPETMRNAPEELLAAFDYGLVCDSEKFLELCLTYSSSQTPMPIRLLALQWIDLKLSVESAKLSEHLRSRAKVRKHELIQELALQLPLDMRFPIMAILEETSENEQFSVSQIERIEEAASRPRLAPQTEELYN